MTPSADESETSSPLQSYLELLRLPNVFTAVADVAMGFFFVQAAWAFSDDLRHTLCRSACGRSGCWPQPPRCSIRPEWCSTTSSTYSSIARSNPIDRCLPAAFPLASARWLGWQLLTLGVVLGCGTSMMLAKVPSARTGNFVLAWLPAIVAAGLAVLIVFYNAGLKRTLLGPAAMGGCRMLNVLLGMSVFRGPWRIDAAVAAAGVGVYIAGLTWFARNDARRSDRRQLAAATLVMLAGVGMIGSLPWLGEELWIIPQWRNWSWNWYGIIALFAVFVLVRGSGDRAAVARTGPRHSPPLHYRADIPRRHRLLRRRGTVALCRRHRPARGADDVYGAVGGPRIEHPVLSTQYSSTARAARALCRAWRQGLSWWQS